MRGLIKLECPFPNPYILRVSMVKSRVQRKESFQGRGDICLRPRENYLSYLRGSDIRISRSETIIFSRKIKEARATLRPISILKVLKTMLGGRDWWSNAKEQDIETRLWSENPKRE